MPFRILLIDSLTWATASSSLLPESCSPPSFNKTGAGLLASLTSNCLQREYKIQAIKINFEVPVTWTIFGKKRASRLSRQIAYVPCVFGLKFVT